MKKIRLLFSLLLPLALASGPLSAQEQVVHGRVISAVDNKPLAGVNVQLKGSPVGTATNVNGYFEIPVPASGLMFFRDVEPPALIFSHTGYRTQEVPVDGRLDIPVVLKEEITVLEEVVVTGNAVGHSQKIMSFSVGSIGQELMTAVPAANFGDGLQGKMAGLRVNRVGGQPGQGPFFQVRSANAIANGQQPLIIVDGVFLNGSTLADLNPEDIDRVEVLKGSAGASLYGSQAANGVIQIFTRRGRGLPVGETRVTYRGEMGFSQEANRYELNELTNRQIVKAEGPQPILGDPTPDGVFTTPLPNLQDYQEDILFRRGAFQSHYLAVEGKSSATNFLASVQRLRDEGVIQSTDGYTRHAFRLNVDHQISDKFSLQASSMYSLSEQDLLPPASNGPGSYLAAGLFLTPMFDLQAPNEEDGSPFDWDIDNTGLGTTNPLYDRANSRQTVARTRLLGNLTATCYAADWLSFQYTAALDHSTNDFEHFLQKGYLSSNVPGLFGPTATAGVQNSNGGGIHRSRRTNNSFISRAGFTAQRAFQGFNAAVTGSFLYEDLTQEFNSGIGENLAVGNIRSLDNARSNVFVASESEEVVAYSGFLVGDVDYKQKYIFSGLFRREGSSLFGPEQRWANYYRMSGAYRLTEDVRIRGVQELKLRASVGTAGIRPTFGQRFETFRLINGVLTRSTLGNNALRPALSRETEVGLNISFWRAFDLEFNYARIETRDQILLVPLSGAAGFRGQWRNAGALAAKVYEAGLNTNLARVFKIKNADVEWTLWTTFERVRQTVASLDVPSYTTGPGLQQSSLFLIEEGQPFGAMVGEVFATRLGQLDGQEGVDPNEYTLNAAGYVVRKDQLGTPEERPYKLVDANGNPLVQPIGDINPDFRVGFAHTFGYKGLRLYTLFDWKKGGDIYNMSRHWLYRDLRHADVSRYPDIAAGFYGSNGLYNVLVANNHFVEDGSFFMLREAALSYTFPAGVFGRRLRSVRLSLIGRNLFTLTKYSGFHPDVTSAPRDENALTDRFDGGLGSDPRTPNGDPSLFAVDAFNYPVMRTVTFSLNVSF